MDASLGTARSIVAHPPAGGVAVGRLPHLDSLRGIAATLVVLHHAHFECEPAGALKPAFAWMREGHFLVTAFLILSGYCLALPTVGNGLLRGGIVRFIGRRARRLLPAYYAALIGSIALVLTWNREPTGRHWDFAMPVTPGSILTHFLLIHNYRLDHLYKINHVFWSIAVEWQVYFVFPLILWIGRKLGSWVAAGLVLVAGYAVHLKVVGTWELGLMPHYYGMFALGMLAAQVGHAPGLARARQEVSWGTISALAMLAMVCVYRDWSYDALDFPFGIAFASALVTLSTPGKMREALAWGPLVALGTWSYSIYLIHAPLQHLAVVTVFRRWGVTTPWEFPILAGLGTPILIAVAWAFHRAFERPFLPAPRRVESGAVPPKHLAGASPCPDRSSASTSSEP